MYRIARYISLIVLMTIVVVGLNSCDITKPKKLFYGIEKNVDQWLLYASQPSNPAKIHEMNPGQYFYDELEGSRVYHFEAHFPDLTPYGSFDMRINNVSNDAFINDVHVDWCVVWGGGGTQAFMSPLPGDEESMKFLSPEITHFDSTKYQPTMPTALVITPGEMSLIKSVLSDTSSATRLDQVRLINRVRTNHGLSPVREEDGR